MQNMFPLNRFSFQQLCLLYSKSFHIVMIYGRIIYCHAIFYVKMDRNIDCHFQGCCFTYLAQNIHTRGQYLNQVKDPITIIMTYIKVDFDIHHFIAPNKHTRGGNSIEFTMLVVDGQGILQHGNIYLFPHKQHTLTRAGATALFNLR